MKVWTSLNEQNLAELAPDGIVAAIRREGSSRTPGQDRFSIKLNLTHDEHRERYRALRTLGHSKPRRINAVCWHGFRDWMLAVFAYDPKARIQTAVADYRGADDFDAKFEATGDRNIGSQIQPLRYRDACDCEISPGFLEAPGSTGTPMRPYQNPYEVA